MGTDAALAVLGQYLHQDIDLDASTPAEVAGNALRLMRPEERENLRIYLASALERFSPSELKGQLNRAAADVSFTSKGAHQFLRMVAEQLAAEQ